MQAHFLQWMVLVLETYFLFIFSSFKFYAVKLWASLCYNINSAKHDHDLLEFSSFTTLSIFTCVWACMWILLVYWLLVGCLVPLPFKGFLFTHTGGLNASLFTCIYCLGSALFY